MPERIRACLPGSTGWAKKDVAGRCRGATLMAHTPLKAQRETIMGFRGRQLGCGMVIGGYVSQDMGHEFVIRPRSRMSLRSTFDNLGVSSRLNLLFSRLIALMQLDEKRQRGCAVSYA